MGEWNHDKVLGIVETLPDPIGSLVAHFPGSAAATLNQRWIDPWFIAQTEKFLQGVPPVVPKLTASPATAAVISSLANTATTHKVRLLSLRPHYFRGFRASTSSINIEESLVVIEGRNSSGKTSLSEALEWLFTGALSRRSTGSARELANCTVNEFRPAGETTWVECTLRFDSDVIVLRRVLIHDYTEAIESKPSSELFCDGRPLTADEGIVLFERLFAGVHPILMQHTLREFVYSSPSDRRRYFERLLQIDELTALIERAVVGDARLRDFPCPGAPEGRRYLDQFKDSCTSTGARNALKEFDRIVEQGTGNIDKPLLSISLSEFGLRHSELHNVEAEINGLQERERTRKFPSIQYLRIPRDAVVPTTENLVAAATAVNAAVSTLQQTEDLVNRMSAADRIAAATVSELIALGVLSLEVDEDQVCPICIDPRRTLTGERVKDLSSSGVATAAFRTANATLNQTKSAWQAAVATFLKSLNTWKFDTSRVAMHPGLDRSLFTMAEAAVQTALAVNESVRSIASTVGKIAPAEASESSFRSGLARDLATLRDRISAHKSTSERLEQALGSGALSDPSYAAREAYLALLRHRTEVLACLRWEVSLKKAQSLLQGIRKGLIETRAAIIEGARAQFTDSMRQVWDFLRADPGGQFSKIGIPTPRGKGYKLEIEVKAILSDGRADSEVDALRVFSESQVNVVGIAAYVTRAAALGHRVLVLDDPVQSMDEEHFKSLAGKLIPELIKQGRQVIILTHSESFARDLSYHHFQSESYATLLTRYSRRKGCWVEEGSRRVSERLYAAEKLMEDGKLEEGWLKVRLAVERLYTLVMKTADSEFQPEKWRDATAEHMWENGAGNVITSRAPDSGKRLREILSLSAKGAHDAAAKSATDLRDAISYIRGLLGPLRVGAG